MAATPTLGWWRAGLTARASTAHCGLLNPFSAWSQGLERRFGAVVRKTPTIRDVARLAAVSPATVSLVLNEVADTRISEGTAARVRAAAAELEYAPNSLARGLRRRRSDTIVLIGDTITTTPYAVHMIEAVQHVAGRNDLLLFLFNTGGDAAVERAGMTLLARQQVDGFIYARMYHQVVDLPDGLRGHTVLLNARTRRAGPPAVVPDDRGGAYAAVTELLAHGHRRIGFLNDARTPPAAALRLEGYRDALRAHGIRLDRRLVVDAQPTLEAGTAAALELTTAQRSPDCSASTTGWPSAPAEPCAGAVSWSRGTCPSWASTTRGSSRSTPNRR